MNFGSKFVYAKKRSAPTTNIELCQYDSFNDDPDTNVISAKFDHLVNLQDSHAGEPYFCSKCSAVLSKLSTLSDPSPLDKKKLGSVNFAAKKINYL